MYISELKLWNFRKYGSISDLIREPDLTVPFTKGLNLLIGENDSGKTAIIDAIKLVLKTHAYEWIKVENSDFFVDANKDKTDKLKIEIHFSGITNDEAKNFIEWCGMADENNEMRPKLILIYQAEIRDNRIIPSDVKAGMDGVGYLLNADARDYLKCTFLKALRDADSELTAKKNSRLSEILQKHELFKKEKGGTHPFEDDFKAINDKIETHFKKNIIKKGIEKIENPYYEKIKSTIDFYLEKFIDEKTASLFSLGKPEIKNILEKLNLGIFGRNNLGLGTMNRLFMAAELLHLKRDWHGLKLCMIEELEAHLHPQAQMKIIEALKDEADKGIQFILTTHSPNIASKVDLKSLIICKNNDVFPMGEGNTKLENKDYVYLERFLDVTKSNLFFAKGVIIVEGWSEEILIPEIAKKLDLDLTKKEVSIVNVASVAYLHFANIFLRYDDTKDMKVPVAIVTDLDNRPDEIGNFKKLEDLNDNDDKKLKAKYDNLLKLKANLDKTGVKLELAYQWTLEWCLFESPTLSALFKESLKEIHPTIFKTNFDDFIPMLKKVNSTKLNKVKLASNLAYKIKKSTEILKNDLEKDDYLKYIILSIKHACNDGN